MPTRIRGSVIVFGIDAIGVSAFGERCAAAGGGVTWGGTGATGVTVVVHAHAIVVKTRSSRFMACREAKSQPVELIDRGLPQLTDLMNGEMTRIDAQHAKRVIERSAIRSVRHDEQAARADQIGTEDARIEIKRQRDV